MSSKVKPCWFCGSDNTHYFEVDYCRIAAEYYCYCDDCESQGPVADTEEEAIKFWNEPVALTRAAQSEYASEET